MTTAYYKQSLIRASKRKDPNALAALMERHKKWKKERGLNFL